MIELLDGKLAGWSLIIWESDSTWINEKSNARDNKKYIFVCYAAGSTDSTKFIFVMNSFLFSVHSMRFFAFFFFNASFWCSVLSALRQIFFLCLFSCVFFFRWNWGFWISVYTLICCRRVVSYLYSNLFFCIRIGPNRNKNKIYLSIVCVFGWVEFNVKMKYLPYSV